MSKTILLLSNFTEAQNWTERFLIKKNVKSIGFIINAKKPNLEIDENYQLKDDKLFEKAGFRVEKIDLEQFDAENIEAVFDRFDAIYVKGGNTFYLLKSMKDSGFDKIVNKLLEKGKIYIGESAGSYVACPSIEMAQWKHQDRNVVGLNDLTGLGIVPFLVTVHFRPEFMRIISPEIEKTKYEVKILTDNEAILIEGSKAQTVSFNKDINNE